MHGFWVVLLALVCATLSLHLAPLSLCDIGTGYDLACARGFETREQANGYTFRWSDDYAEIHMPHFGYGTAHIVVLNLRSGRPAGSPPVQALFGLNGRPLLQTNIPFLDRRYALLLPARPLVGDLARIQITSTTWKPSPISRTFGLIVQQAKAYPTDGFRWPGLLLVASWCALLLAVSLLSKQRLAWVVIVACVLLALCRIPTGIYYMPWLALLVGVGIGVGQASSSSNTSVGQASSPSNTKALPYTRGLGGDKSTTTTLIYVALSTAFYLSATLIDIPYVWIRVLLLASAGVLALVAALSSRLSPAALIASAAVLRLVWLGARLLSGTTLLDKDIELFYSYGMALRDIGLPEVEYPTGALLTWGALSWVSGDSREAFALLLPLLNSVCDVVIVAALVWLATMPFGDSLRDRLEAYPTANTGLQLAACYAWSPLLEPFIFAKYDALPAVLLAGGLVLFAYKRPGLSGVALALGAVIKWTPLLATPFLMLHLLRQRCGSGLGRFILLHGGVLALCSLPFALQNRETFLMPYRLQGGRSMNGESFWFLVTLLLEPAYYQEVGAPWGALSDSILPVNLMVAVQLATLAVLGILAWLRPLTRQRTLAFAALAPALFLILNRIFSPQYVLSISVSLLLALALLPPASVNMHRVLLVLLVGAQGCNLFVWPFFTTHYWVLANSVVYSAVLGISIWVIYAAVFGYACASNASHR